MITRGCGRGGEQIRRCVKLNRWGNTKLVIEQAYMMCNRFVRFHKDGLGFIRGIESCNTVATCSTFLSRNCSRPSRFASICWQTINLSIQLRQQTAHHFHHDGFWTALRRSELVRRNHRDMPTNCSALTSIA